MREPIGIQDDVLKREFYNKLPSDKIQINWNKRPIAMSLFLSFLKVEVTRSEDHLGSTNGWTLLKNDELKLRIGGGIVNGTELLDSLQYGTKLSNQYNDCVNPFYLFGILTEEGQSFFIDYYKQDIENIISDAEIAVSNLERQLAFRDELLKKIKREVRLITPQTQKNQ